MGILADLFSYGDGLKRKVNNLIADPAGTIGLGVTRFGEDQNALLNLMSNAYPMQGEKTVLNSPEQIAEFRKQAAQKMTEQAVAGATVWHGSPHKFDKFDSSKIGTGEGAQAYGHGLYLAESPAVASEYQKALSAGRGNGADDVMARILDAAGGDTTKAAAIARQRAQYANIPGGKEQLEGIAQKLESGADPRGSLYKVDLPDEHIAKMLDWDKPLSQQHPDVQAALSGIETKFPEIPDFNLRKWMDADPLASTWHNALQRDLGADPAMITQTLKDRGVPGIRYLDGGSRADGVGTSNFVVFPGNEGLLQIQERNGQPINTLAKALGK